MSSDRREACILHADLDAFFASVEQRDDPSLRGRPVLVGGGVVLAASYEARARGVRSAMGGGTARRLCPDAVVVTPRWEAYLEASRAVFAVLEEAAPVVEKMSIDEAFLDVRGLERISGTPPEIAARLRADVRAATRLPISVGVASTRSLAKVASAAAKPDGLCAVAAGEEAAFLWPLPVERLWGVGPATARRLHAGGVHRVGQAAQLEEARLVGLLGPAAGRQVFALARNHDPRPVRRGRRRRSFGAQAALGRPRLPPAGGDGWPELETTLSGLVDRVGRRMRAKGRAGRTVTLRLRFGDFTRASRSRTLREPTAATRPLLRAATELLRGARPEAERRGLTLVGVTVANLDGEGGQLEFPLDGGGGPALDAALDAVRERFGTRAVTRAALLGDARSGDPDAVDGADADADVAG